MIKKDNIKLYECYKHMYRKYTLLESEQAETNNTLTTEQIQAADRLIRLATHNVLQQKSPFLFHILQELKVIKDQPDIPTMAVDAVGNIFINRRFALEELRTKERVAGVLAHETLHILNATIPRQKWRTHMLGDYSLWNIVTDYVMNAQLLDDGFELPEMGMIPQGGKGHWVIDLSKLHPSLTGVVDITNKRCEAVYDEILKHLQGKTSQKPQSGKGQPGKGQPGNGQGEGQPGEGEGQGGNQQGQGRGNKPGEGEGEGQGGNQPGGGRGSSPGGWDVHIRGNGVKSSNNDSQESANTANELNNKLKRMAEDLKRNGVDMSKYFEPEEQPVHDWKDILKEYLDKASTVRDILSPKKFNLTFGHWKADKRVVEGDLIRAVIAIDTSGSIGQKEFNEVLSELRSLCESMKNLELRILLWHTDVYQDVVATGESEEVFDNIKQINLQSGGTTISSVANVLNQSSEIEYSVVIYFTDGYVEGDPVFSSDIDSVIILTKGTGDGVVPNLEKALNKYRSYSDQRVYKTDL